jgi:hypothetical protein
MKKTLKITLNLFVFILIAGFGYYMVYSILSGGKTILPFSENAKNTFVSPYKKMHSFTTSSDIVCFDIYEHTLYAALSGKVSVFDLSGKQQHDFAIKKEVRDIVVEESGIYLLYPTEIEVFDRNGEKITGWAACSDNSDYVAITATKDYIFVTDAENKLITQFDKHGQLVRFIRSPRGFIIPSYSFDIININDTIYCANSGRHKIESYTLDGKYITSFGVAGAKDGAFAGCCNPSYLAVTQYGDILTSEKGNPRISCFSREGKFRTILLDSKTLGGGTDAYRMKIHDDKMYIAGKNTLSEFMFDPQLAAQSACAGCLSDCPLKK